MVKPIFDSQEACERLDNDIELLCMICEMFLVEGTKELTHFLDRVPSGDSKTLAGLAHKLKGQAANVGAARMQELLVQIEKDLKLGKKADQIPEIKQLREGLEFFKREFFKWKESLQNQSKPNI